MLIKQPHQRFKTPWLAQIIMRGPAEQLRLRMVCGEEKIANHADVADVAECQFADRAIQIAWQFSSFRRLTRCRK